MIACLTERGPKARRILLGATIVVLPATMLPRAVLDPINTPKIALLTLVVGLVSGIRLAEGAAGTGFAALRGAAVPVAASAVPLAIAWAFSDHRAWELFGLYPRYLGLVPYLLTVAFALLVADAFAGRPWSVAWCLAGGGALVGLYSLIQAAGVDPFVWSVETNVRGIPRTGSTLGNPNFSGAFQSVGLPVSVAVALWGPGRRDVAWVFSALSFVGLLTSFSEGPWVAGAGGLALVGAWALRLRRPRSIRWGVAVAIACGLMSAGAVVSTLFNEAAVSVFGPTAQARGWYWQTAVEMGAERPVTGWGPNIFAVRGVSFRPEQESSVAYWVAEDPHNLALSTLVSAGALGLAGLALLGVWFVGKARAAVAAGSAAGVALLAGGSAYFLQGLVGVDEPAVRIAGWVCLAGLATAVSQEDKPTGRASSSAWTALLLIPALGLVASSVWWAQRMVVADAEMLRGIRAAQNNDPEPASLHFRRALEFRDEYGYREIYGTMIGELGTRRAPAGAAYIEEMRNAFGYLDHFPHVQGLVAEARLLYAWGQKTDPSAYPEALELYQRASALDPHHPLLAVETSDVLRSMGRAENALSLLQRYEFSGARYPSFHGALALVYIELGDVDLARAAISASRRLTDHDSRTDLAVQLLGGSGT